MSYGRDKPFFSLSLQKKELIKSGTSGKERKKLRNNFRVQ